MTAVYKYGLHAGRQKLTKKVALWIPYAMDDAIDALAVRRGERAVHVIRRALRAYFSAPHEFYKPAAAADARQVTVAVTPDQHRQLRLRAEGVNADMGEVALDALVQYVEGHGAEELPISGRKEMTGRLSAARVPRSIERRITAIAERHGVTQASIMREAIGKWLLEYDQLQKGSGNDG